MSSSKTLSHAVLVCTCSYPVWLHPGKRSLSTMDAQLPVATVIRWLPFRQGRLGKPDRVGACHRALARLTRNSLAHGSKRLAPRTTPGTAPVSARRLRRVPRAHRGVGIRFEWGGMRRRVALGCLPVRGTGLAAGIAAQAPWLSSCGVVGAAGVPGADGRIGVLASRSTPVPPSQLPAADDDFGRVSFCVRPVVSFSSIY